MTTPVRLDFDSPIGDAPIYFLGATDSTMDDARGMVDEGAPSGVVIVADYQRVGRGRRPGRQWHAYPGECLMFTLALRDPEDVATASLRAGVAVAQALERLCGLEARIKWPNDVLVGDRKIAGVLCDFRGRWLFVGAGINLTQSEFPGDLAMPATSVSLEGKTVVRDELLRSILEGFSQPAGWFHYLEQRLWGAGTRISITQPDGTTLSGDIAGIDESGLLLVRSQGKDHSIVAGDIERAEGPTDAEGSS